MNDSTLLEQAVQSGDQPHPAEPVPWHHEIFHPDGTPYDKAETDVIRSFRGR